MIFILNGPNLNLLGSREPEIYGTECFGDFLEKLRREFPDTDIRYFQSNSEGALIDAIQENGLNPECTGLIVNPGGYSHYSVAIADAFASVNVPVMEVHLSNIHAREEYRRRSVTASRASGVIAGLGLEGYRLALMYLLGNS